VGAAAVGDEGKAMPTELGKFTLLNHMGTGGVASVYRARDNEDGKIVAIKIFEPTEERPADLMRRLKEREVRMLVSVQHPNVVKFYEAGVVDERYYYAMEFVGDSLLMRMRKRDEFTLLEKVRILRQCANALQAMHHQGIVHRDIKPGNILLDRDRHGAIQVKVTDLGIAKNVSEADIVRQATSKRIPGTPKYLSPEQIKLMAVDGRADIFSLGVVAYELLAGTAPVKAQSTDEYLEANLRQDPEPISRLNEQIPPFLDQLVAKMLVKDREQRSDSDTLARDLELVEQHLVSDAPLVEYINASSVFYVPLEPEEEQEAAEKGGSPILKVSWAAVAVLVALGVFSGYYLWPVELGSAAGETVAVDVKPSDEVLLQRALGYAAEGSEWHALVLLRRINGQSLDERQRAAFERLRQEVHRNLAGQSYETGTKMLAGNRLREAEVLLKRMESFFPEVAQTLRLREEIEDYRKAASLEKRWEQELSQARALKEKAQFQEALGKLDQLLEQFAQHGEKVSVVRGAVVSVLNMWGSALAEGAVTPAEVKEYLDSVSRYEERNWPELALRVRTDEIYFKLAQYYQQRGNHEEAARCYDLIVKNFQGPLAERAKAAGEQIAKELLLQPIDLGAFARKFKREGFSNKLWRTEAGPRGKQTHQDRTVLFTQGRAEAPATNLLETLRPIRNLGFKIGAEFKVQTSPAPSGGWQTGLQVEDKRGNAITLGFDGSQYTMTRNQKVGERNISAGTTLRKAFGDEEGRWHRMSLHYLYDIGKVEVLLDQERVGQFGLDLGEFRLRIFLRTDAAAQCSVAFRDIACEP